MATLLLIIIYLAFISLGLPDSMLGAIWPAAYAELGVPVSFAGIASVVVTSGTVISSLLSVRVIRRFGTGRVTAVCVLLTASALLGISFTGSFAAILLLALPLGLGGGAIDAALNNYVALHYKASHMSFLHGFWGVGASISPLIVSYYLMQNGNWHGGFRTVSIIQFCAGVGDDCQRSRSGRRYPHAKPDELIGEPVVVSNRAALKRRGAIYSVLSFFSTARRRRPSDSGRRPFRPACAELSRVAADGVRCSSSASWAGAWSPAFLRCASRSARAHLLGLVTAAMGALLLALPLPQGFALAGLLLFGLRVRADLPQPAAYHAQALRQGYSQAVIGLQMASAYIGSSSHAAARRLDRPGRRVWRVSYYLLACLARCTRASSSATAGRIRRCAGGGGITKNGIKQRGRSRLFFTITPRAIQTFVRYNGERSFSAATNTGVALLHSYNL
ncbi:MAG: MFS transporter [Eubacteriales bacterium]